jgi:hypothetical protein
VITTEHRHPRSRRQHHPSSSSPSSLIVISITQPVIPHRHHHHQPVIRGHLEKSGPSFLTTGLAPSAASAAILSSGDSGRGVTSPDT